MKTSNPPLWQRSMLQTGFLMILTAVLTMLVTTAVLMRIGVLSLRERQDVVAERGAAVMPFSLEETTHIFEELPDGGIQRVVADDPNDTTEIALIRDHLRSETVKFQQGNFADPAAIHGDDMPGLAALQAGAPHIEVRYAALPDGGQITFTTTDETLVTALHNWFAAQTADHGNHATDARVTTPTPSAPPTNSSYAKQLDSPVRGLHAQEVEDLRYGRGAGYARMAELNSYPGPSHALDFREQLGLTSQQVTEIEATFATMDAAARQVGQQIVEQETALSAAFASGSINETALQEQTNTIAQLYGQYRTVHLRAHVAIRPLFSGEQIARYNGLRGYASDTTRAASDPSSDHLQHHNP